MCAGGGAHSTFLAALESHRVRNRLRNHDVVDGMPGRSTFGQFKDPLVRAGDQSSVAGLLQSEYIPAVQARAVLLPALSAIMAKEHAAEFAVVDQADVQGVRFLAISQNRTHIT